MLCLLCNKKGISMLEVVIAIFLTTIGVLAIFSLQSPAVKTTARADYLGRAAEIMNKELESRELLIMNPCNTVTVGTTTTSVKVSGMTGNVGGDATYNITTKIESVAATTNMWKITVTVTWPINSTGIKSERIVSRQEFFKNGCT